MDSGLITLESTIRCRSSATERREPTPASGGARLPWNRSSAIGAVWQSKQRFCRFATSALPAVASPRCAVSGASIRGNCVASALHELTHTTQSNSAITRINSHHYARFRLSDRSGTSRTRFPVAANAAFNTAGNATAMVGSPTPPQNPPEVKMMVSTFGI